MILNMLKKLEKIINNDNIFMIGRLSGNETILSGKVKNNISISKELIHNLLYVAGLYFKDNNSIVNYVNLYWEAILNSDLLGVWEGNGPMRTMPSDFYNILNTKHTNIIQIQAQCLEPYYFMDDDNYCFNKVIKNKKILIISSHIETMKLQLKHLDKLFNKNIFENNEFIFIKPPMTHAGNHNNIDWEINFNEFKDKILNSDNTYDLALVSCGGYGMLICDFIKNKMKKNVIYVGGALQIWFGIKGSRWDTSQKMSKMYNEYWIRTLKSEIPEGKEYVENSCYW